MVMITKLMSFYSMHHMLHFQGLVPTESDFFFLQLLVTNTVPQKIHEQKCTKIKTIDVSLMFAEAIRRIYHGESMSYLFRNIPMED